MAFPRCEAAWSASLFLTPATSSCMTAKCVDASVHVKDLARPDSLQQFMSMENADLESLDLASGPISILFQLCDCIGRHAVHVVVLSRGDDALQTIPGSGCITQYL